MITKTPTYAGLTDTGQVRKRNEDNWSAAPELGLFILADGMGGAARGDVASRMVVDRLPVMVQKILDEQPNAKLPDLAGAIGLALVDLSGTLKKHTVDNPELNGMGATVVLTLIRNQQAIIAHMGDSRAYILRNSLLSRLTKDHSIVQILIDNGEITPEEAAVHPSRSHITQCVGMQEEPNPDVRVIDLEPQDRILLCSDGLTGMISEQEILDLLSDSATLHDICQELISAANKAGGRDNITVIIIDT